MKSLPATHLPSSQRGAVALLVTLLMCAALLLATLFGHRGALVEARISAQQAQATRAFEAAEAGLEWAIAQLNRPQAIDANCLAAATGLSFRARHLEATAVAGASEMALVPRSWSAAGVPMPLHAACVRAATGWRCHCPSDAPAALAEPEALSIAPAFRIHLEPTGTAGVLRLVSHGCTRGTVACLSGNGAASGSDATARVQVELALVPALLSAPPAPLVARGDIRNAAAVSLTNPDARSGGAVAHAGGAIELPQAALETPAGSSLANAWAAHDAAFAAQSPDALFVSLFGAARSLWRDLPMTQHVDCALPCAAALTSAIAQASGPAQVWVEGDLALDGPLELGSTERPIALVVSGHLMLRGDIALHGIAYANRVSWTGPAGAGARLRGAIVSETDYRGDAGASFIYEPRVLDSLRQAAGSLVRVPGSWRDF